MAGQWQSGALTPASNSFELHHSSATAMHFAGGGGGGTDVVSTSKPLQAVPGGVHRVSVALLVVRKFAAPSFARTFTGYGVRGT